MLKYPKGYMVTAVTVTVALKETAENLAISVFLLNFAT